MDPDVQFYLERFRKEEEGLSEASRLRIEWGEKESRHQSNIRALLQLVTDRAQEIMQPLPEDIVSKATTILGGYIQTAFKGLAVTLPAVSGNEEAELELPVDRTDGDGSDGLTAPPRSGATEPNRVDWIAAAVAASGAMGITPPEILARAEIEGVSMHHNYPYIVLKKLIERRRVRRNGARYFDARR